MIYIITLILIIILFIVLYFRKKNKKARKKYITDFIQSMNEFIEKKKNDEIKEKELKKNIINDMGTIIAYQNPNYLYDLKNTDYTLQIPNYLEKVYYKKI